MGFFTKPEAAGAGARLEQLSHEQITRVLDARELGYGVDDDGDIGGFWDGHLFYFFRLGQSQEYLQVRGRWGRKIGVDQETRAVAIVNEWNAGKLWPKGYVRVEDDVLGVYAEHTVDYEHGVTDEQLDLHLACAISTGLQLFEHLDEAYPDEAEVAKAEYEKNS
ncbi:MAG TPA: YbjN domain-containing protein [Cellulomonas sp.]